MTTQTGNLEELYKAWADDHILIKPARVLPPTAALSPQLAQAAKATAAALGPDDYAQRRRWLTLAHDIEAQLEAQQLDPEGWAYHAKQWGQAQESLEVLSPLWREARSPATQDLIGEATQKAHRAAQRLSLIRERAQALKPWPPRG